MAVGHDGKTENFMMSKMKIFNPQRTLSGSFLVNPCCCFGIYCEQTNKNKHLVSATEATPLLSVGLNV